MLAATAASTAALADATPPGLTVWLTGLPGAGKTTSAMALRREFDHLAQFVVVLDGDHLRRGLSRDLGFTNEDRDESVRRAGEIALLLSNQGAITVVSLVSPRRGARDAVRARHADEGVGFFEVYLDASLEICEQRDPKSLYRRTRDGEIDNMTGVDNPYEAPLAPELVLATGEMALEQSVAVLRAAVIAALSTP
ncbi:MAG TPA: adenylyl-sulfate kinase [Acidimicrobiales bacterium]|nr:adenylyl-sulfate kinase [Acidimicrobiales bacterium]